MKRGQSFITFAFQRQCPVYKKAAKRFLSAENGGVGTQKPKKNEMLVLCTKLKVQDSWSIDQQKRCVLCLKLKGKRKK